MYNPLVSIVVASYNAEHFIEETLDSCINQLYKNIEIIITDDYSSDATVNICNEWINKKKSNNNVRIILITSGKNEGIPKNLNKAIPYCQGDWVKFIGSDDIMKPDAIVQLVKYSDMFKIRPIVIFSLFETFGSGVEVGNIYPLGWTKYVIKLKASWCKEFLAMLHLNNLAPAAFINNSLFRDEGVIFNERYELLEDLPLWLKLICEKRDVVFLDVITVEYRIHSNQVTTQSGLGINKKLLSDLFRLNDFRLEKNII
ncbi:hypothetical protein yinte0001_26350 [Yersinia intermedia ATCC 29909]|uniref:glycosyltransferase n=1 Tax=Yersinia intermedia TaxID=631 RepID=UPI0001A53A6A|nr:glycosyltransferase [Yersinia intermedia]EEQ20615.1 hypothetical protein yinte0001_26350 [Yersinia intermedia ATCC 29909]